MAAQIPDEFIELLEALAEERIDEAGRARLVAMAGEDAGLQAVLREHFAVSRALASLAPDDSGFAERTAAHVMKTAEEGEFAFAGKVTRRIVRHRLAKALAVAAILTLAVLPLAWKTLWPAEEVATLVRMDEAGIVLSRTIVRAGEKLAETSGLIRLDFGSGAVVAVEAPAKLTAVSRMEIALESGRLNAWCPESAHGFKVRTGSAALTDLGTSFGISASADGRSEFVVLDGLVEVEKGSEKVRLEQGKALTSNSKDTLQSVAFDPSGFKNTWPLASGILATKGSVVPVGPDVPEKVALMEDSDHVLVIPERRGVPFTEPLEAEITEPGSMPGSFDGSVKTVQPRAGRRLRSILLRYDPVGVSAEDHFLRLEGEVTFDRPVLAISCHKDSLEKSDKLFATGTWTATHRGIELKQIDNDPDSVTLSADRRTVKVIFYAGASTDEIRVFLED
jgi:hypothetical protein